MNNALSNDLNDCLSAALAAHQKGDLSNAILLYHKVLEFKADHLQTWLNLGVALRSRGESANAIACFQAALRLNPHIPGAHLALGAALKDLGKWEEAAECCRRELKLNSKNADAHYNLGLLRQNQDRLREASQCYEKALKIKPDYVDALVNFGCLYHQEGRFALALDCLKKALSLQPSLPRAHWSHARTLLVTGDFLHGFEEYEWRWKLDDFNTPAWNFPQPLWQGESLSGRTILLHAEQGAGDTFQFIRYVPMVLERGGRIIVGCPADLAQLISTIPGIAEVATSREKLPTFDTHAPVMSLPRILRTTLETVPAQVPYLTQPHDKVIGLPAPGDHKPKLRLGLVWAGGISDKKRNVPVELFEPLINLPGISLFSLQVGRHAGDLQALPPGAITDCSALLKDFSDTAHMIGQLDGIISVDTSVAHLAGALGRPVWTLLHFSADWRWLRGREDSPWYPTMRLFRQVTQGDWKPVISKIADELQQILRATVPAEAFAMTVTGTNDKHSTAQKR